MKRPFPVALSCLLLSSLFNTAQAEYSVMYEELYPTTMMKSRAIEREKPRSSPSSQPVLFIKGSRTLGPIGRSGLDTVARNAINEEITVVGRPDFAKNRINSNSLALDRAASIRNYLVLKGVARNSITIETEEATDSEQNSSLHTTYKVIQPAAFAVNPSNAKDKEVRPLFIEKKPKTWAELRLLINKGLQSGEMSPSEVILLLRATADLETLNTEPQASPNSTSQANFPAQKLHPRMGPIVTNEVEALPVLVQPNVSKIPTIDISKWEILVSDVTLKKTLERWAQLANWELIWTDLPEFKNPGYVKLENRDFISACDYVLRKAKAAAKEAGFEMFVTAYPNHVLVISREAPQ